MGDSSPNAAAAIREFRNLLFDRGEKLAQALAEDQRHPVEPELTQPVVSVETERVIWCGVTASRVSSLLTRWRDSTPTLGDYAKLAAGDNHDSRRYEKVEGAIKAFDRYAEATGTDEAQRAGIVPREAQRALDEAIMDLDRIPAPQRELTADKGTDPALVADKSTDILRPVKKRRPTAAAINCAKAFRAKHRSEPGISRTRFVEDWAEEHNESASGINKIIDTNPEMLVDEAAENLPTKRRQSVSKKN